VIRIFRHYIPRSFIALGLIEFLVLMLSVYAGVWVRFMDDAHGRAEVEPIAAKALLFALAMMTTMIVVGLYQRNFREGMGGMLLRVLISALLGLTLMSVIFYAFPETFLGRGAFGMAFGMSVVGIIMVRALFFRLVDQDTLARRVLVLGAGKRAMAIAGLRRKSDRRGCHIVGYVHVPGEHDEVDPELVIRRDTALLELAQPLNVDEIVIAVEDRRKNFPVHEILDCRMAGIEVMDILSFIERQLGRVELKLLHPSWLIFSDGFRYGVMRVITKRIFDVVASLLVLSVTWPFMIAAAAAIFLESGGRGPIFYHQVRVGENWQLFRLTKFRSMRVDAEADGVARWAQKNDGRVTLVGAFIRKTRIDELPQLFNVLRGDMSFVGPRPERPVFVEQLSAQIPFYSERHRVKPGITGWAQISYSYGASEEDAVHKLQYDLYYVKNYSLFLDLLILLQTAEVVLWGRGAR
jgi:sugar transferase (PEP-CTERM system associated)